MMSSSNPKISAKNVRVTEHSKAVNDKFVVEEERFEERFIEEKKQSIHEKVKNMEQRMLEEVEEKRQHIIEKAYEEGKENAIQEAQERIKQNIREVLEETNALLEDANQMKKKIFQEAEELKNYVVQEQKNEIIALATVMASKIIQKEVQVSDMNMDKIYEDALKKITYETKRIHVKVHPTLRTWVETSEYSRYDSRVDFFYDLNIKPGDLFVETDKEFIDVSIQTKLEQLKQKMRGVINDSL